VATPKAYTYLLLDGNENDEKSINNTIDDNTAIFFIL
jgi:hypothetical protein